MAVGSRAYSYSNKGLGAMLLTKVVMGKPHMVNAFGAVSSCPAGYNSVGPYMCARKVTDRLSSYVVSCRSYSIATMVR